MRKHLQDTALYMSIFALLTIINSYYLDLGLYSGLIMLALTVAIIVFMVKRLKSFRATQNSDEYGFKQAFGYTFLSYLSYSVAYLLFFFIIVFLIDPGVQEVVIERGLESTYNMMSNFLSTESDEFRQAMYEAEKGLKNQFTTEGIIKNNLWSISFGLIVSLIIGAIYRNKNTAV